MCSTNEITKSVYIIQKESKKIYIFWKGLVFLVFIEIALSIFYLQILQSSGFFYFSVITPTLKSENWRSFKDYDVYLINVYRMSHTLNRN